MIITYNQFNGKMVLCNLTTPMPRSLPNIQMGLCPMRNEDKSASSKYIYIYC